MISRYLPILLAMVIFMQMLDTTILNTALPQMALDLKQSPLNMQSVVIAYALTLALLMPLSAYLCDYFGTKKVFFVSLLLFILGSVCCALSPNLTSLIIGRIIQGIGGAMLTAAPRLVMIKSYEKNQLLRMINFIVMPALIGPIIGPVLGGYLAEYVSWHWIFWINVPIGLLAMAMTMKIMPDFREPPEKVTLDKMGLLWFASGAAALSLAMEWIHRPNGIFTALILLIIFVLTWFQYYRHAQTYPKPLYSLDLWKIRTFRLGILGNLVSRLGISAMPFLLPLLLQIGFAQRASIAGLVMAPVALGALCSKPLVKPLMKRFGYRKMLSLNTLLIGCLIASYAWFERDVNIIYLIPLLFVMGMCNSFQFSGMNSIAIADLRSHQQSSGTNFVAVNQQLAVGLGVAVSATVLQFLSQNMDLENQSIHQAFRYTFVIMGCLTALSSLIFARLHRLDGHNLLN